MNLERAPLAVRIAADRAAARAQKRSELIEALRRAEVLAAWLDEGHPEQADAIEAIYQARKLAQRRFK